ncbi:MAG: methyltransferase domain-containing protein [Deltaproteobacteria bacterium]|nr:methyltransferase domain-containing protein [Deltaproteobacteria bacterium]
MTDAPQYADPDRYADLAGFRGEWRDLFWNGDFLELMSRRWGLDGVERALDVGCGAGHWGRTMLGLLPPSATMVGVDREPDFFALARSTARERGLSSRLSFVEGTAEALPFGDDSFDLVTCQLVLIHVADAKVALREMLRVVRPGGLLVVVEPDNRAGNLALLGTSDRLDDDAIADLVSMQLVCERGKRALGEGDNSVGAVLPGLFGELGLDSVRAHTNDRCIDLAPPYQTASMKIALEQELSWARESINMLLGTHDDTRRLYDAGGGEPAGFERGWAAVTEWLRRFERGVEAGTFHAGRGFVLYLVSGRKPAAKG